MYDFEPTGSSRGRGIVRLKSVEKIYPAINQQFLLDRCLTGMRLGSLLNFGAALMKDRITLIVRGE
jgi:hypothetical protein